MTKPIDLKAIETVRKKMTFLPTALNVKQGCLWPSRCLPNMYFTLLIREKFGLARCRVSETKLHFKNRDVMKAFFPMQEPKYDITII